MRNPFVLKPLTPKLKSRLRELSPERPTGSTPVTRELWEFITRELGDYIAGHAPANQLDEILAELGEYDA